MHGSATFTNIRIERHTAIKNLFDLRNSTVDFIHFELNAFSGSLIKAQDNCFIGIHRSILSNLTYDSSISTFANSSLSLIDSKVTSFDPTFLSATLLRLHVLRSEVSYGGHLPRSRDFIVSGFLECTYCLEITIIGSIFHHMLGRSGAAISNQCLTRASLFVVQRSAFSNCEASQDGGAVRLESVYQYEITDSVFSNNTAIRGAGMFLGCSLALNCTGKVISNTFAYNTALEGGGLKWTGTRPFVTNNTDHQNFASYGPFEASIPTQLEIANPPDQLIQAPGQRLKYPIVIQLKDIIGQVVSSDNTTFISLSIITSESSPNVTLLGNVPLRVENGVGTFSSMIIRAKPKSIIMMKVEAPGLEKISARINVQNTTRFGFIMRECMIGEVQSLEGCYLCPRESYSLNPLETECRQCKPGVVCPGAASLLLNEGLWRHSNVTDEIVSCPEQNLCTGGEDSNCGVGQVGRLCAQCTNEFFSFGHIFCFSCVDVTIHVLGVIIGFVASLTIPLICLFATVSTAPNSGKIAFGKILFLISHSFLSISCVAVGWKFEFSILFIVNEVFLSFGLAAISSACFQTSLSWIYLRAIIASVLPMLLVLVAVSVALILKRMKKVSTFRSGFYQCICLLLFHAYPYIVKSTASLVACRQMEGLTFWLFEDLGQQCWVDDHLSYFLVLFVPLALIYLVAIPIAVFYFAVYKPKKRYFSVFWRCGYIERFLNWDVRIIMYNCGLITVLSIATHIETIIQIMFCFWANYFALVAIVFKNPYTNQYDSSVAISAQSAMCILAALSFYFQETLPMGFNITALIGYFGLGTLLLYICVLIGLFVTRKQKSVVEVRGAKVDVSVAEPPRPPNNTLLEGISGDSLVSVKSP